MGEIATNTYGGGTPRTDISEYWDGKISWIQSSDLTEGDVLNVRAKKHISEQAVNKSATRVIPANSIAVVTRVGVGKLAIIPYFYATSQDFLSLSSIKADIKFCVYAL